jgi:hypothetical protein
LRLKVRLNLAVLKGSLKASLQQRARSEGSASKPGLKHAAELASEPPARLRASVLTYRALKLVAGTSASIPGRIRGTAHQVGSVTRANVYVRRTGANGTTSHGNSPPLTDRWALSHCTRQRGHTGVLPGSLNTRPGNRSRLRDWVLLEPDA